MRDLKSPNPQLAELISQLKKEGHDNDVGIWLEVARYLSMPRSQRVAVNLSGINRNTKRGDVIVVPGKVLGSGSINHSITVAAFSVSEKAKVKLDAAKAKYLSIPELMVKNPKGSNVKIIR